MTNCTSCGAEVTGKKFCPECGTPVQPAASLTASIQPASTSTCPRCNGEVRPGAAFCLHCGTALQASAPVSQPTTHTCPSCQTEVPLESAFCTNCGHDMRVSAPQTSPVTATPTPSFCTNCGHQNNPGVHFCASCGSPLTAVTTSPMAQPQYQQQGPYPQQPQYPQQPPPYSQPQYPQQYGQPQYQQPYPQQYGQPQYPQQYGAYQQEPMLGQSPMALHCPTCMTPSPAGTPYCPRCNTSLAGIVPTPANIPAGQQGGLGGFLQGSGGQMAMGALGGAAAVIGGEMLLHGIENDIGFGSHHHHEYDDQGNPIGEIARDIGLL